MQKLASLGYGHIVGNVFYKNPNVTTEMLGVYDIKPESYKKTLNAAPACGGSSSDRVRRDQQETYQKLYGLATIEK